MDLRIREYPHDEAALRRPAVPVLAVDEDLVAFVDALIALVQQSDAYGLAATQVDRVGSELPSPALFVMAKEPLGYVAILNPEIIETKGLQTKDEGCLSFASVPWALPAPVSLRLRYMTREGFPAEGIFEGIEARCVAHETDHLAGKLMIDRMARWERRRFLRDVEAERQRLARAT